MSIRDSPPPFDTNIPVVTSAGGTSAAYKDPNSPESLMKKAATMNAQAAVDSTYDVKEGFVAATTRQIFISLGIILFVLWLRNKFRTKKQSIYIDTFWFFALVPALWWILTSLLY